MKTTWKLLSLLFVALLTFSACSKDDDPADNDFFVDNYKGTTSYVNTNGDDDVESGQGTVFVTKVGDTYNFGFDRNIPNINGIKMEKGDNNVIFFNSDALGSISINQDDLTILYHTDGKTWTANCKRD